MSAAGPLPRRSLPHPGNSAQRERSPVSRSRSIHATLVAWLAVGLAVSLVAAALLTYQRTRDEANALFDLQLKQTAASIIGMPIAGSGPFPGSIGDDGLVVQIWDRQGVRIYRSRPQASDVERMAEQSTPGFTTIDTPSGPYRVFSVFANGQIVQVGQPLHVRSELAARLALSTILPLAIITPIIALLVWIAVRRGLAPLGRVADAVQKRAPGQLAPLAGGWPREIEPLVEALNGLLGRLQRVLDAQRAFVADAAHELRTPLAALALQAQLAEREATPDARERALADLRGGLGRATRVVEQLLALAREEPGVTSHPLVQVDLALLAREVVASLSAIAAAKSIDLGMADADAQARIEGDPDALKTLLANLIDNAIRYTPPGGRVDVAVERQADAPVIAVRDSGPGIPAAERDRVFERFARGVAPNATGSGLGLAIVKRIVERHGGALALGNGLDGKGVGVVIRFPAARAKAS
jgi:two-component system, OmpR family, sensor kinase